MQRTDRRWRPELHHGQPKSAIAEYRSPTLGVADTLTASQKVTKRATGERRSKEIVSWEQSLGLRVEKRKV